MLVDASALDLALSTAQRQMKEVLFSRELARIATVEKSKETKHFVCIGDELLPEDAAAATIAARERRALALATLKMEAQLLRTQAELSNERPLRILDGGDGGAPRHTAAAAERMDGAPAADGGDERAEAGAVVRAQTYVPRFDRYLNAMGERVRTLEQLKQAILAIAATRRLERRLAKIDAALARAGARESSAAGGARGASAPGAGAAATLASSSPHPLISELVHEAPRALDSRQIGSHVFPRAVDDPFGLPGLAPAPPLGGFETVTLLPLRVPRVHELSKYRVFTIDDAPTGSYAPVETARPLRVTAEDEYGSPLPTGAAAPAAARVAQMPDTITPADAVWGHGALAAGEAAKRERIAFLQRAAAERAVAEKARRDAPKSRADERARAAKASAVRADAGGVDGPFARTRELDGALDASVDALRTSSSPPADATATRALAAEATQFERVDGRVDSMALPARPLAYAPGPRLTELDPLYVLQPAPLGRASFVERELVGTGSVRALSRDALLSDGWAQPLSPWAEADPLLLPALMRGPLDEDLEVRAATRARSHPAGATRARARARGPGLRRSRTAKRGGRAALPIAARGAA